MKSWALVKLIIMVMYEMNCIFIELMESFKDEKSSFFLFF